MNKLSYQDVKDIAKGRADRSKKINGMNWMWVTCTIMVAIMLIGLALTIAKTNDDITDILTNTDSVYTSDDGSQLIVKYGLGYAIIGDTSYVLNRGIDAESEADESISYIAGFTVIPIFVVVFILIYHSVRVAPKYKDAIIQYYLDKGELPDSDFNEK
jgi:hypothetical protein